MDISGCRLLGCEQNLAYHIEDCLRTNPRLQRLHIRKAGLTDTAVSRIATGLQFTDNLTFLDLSANKLSRDSANKLSRDSAGLLCPVLEKLEVLDLSSNRIQSEGAIKIAHRIIQSEIKLNTLGKILNFLRRVVVDNSTNVYGFLKDSRKQKLKMMEFKQFYKLLDMQIQISNEYIYGEIM